MKDNSGTMRADDWRDSKTATQCFICRKDVKDGDKKVPSSRPFLRVDIEDVHTTSAAFNLRYKVSVFLHPKNCDSYLIIERANELSERAKTDVIA